jgi:hypothetical protein
MNVQRIFACLAAVVALVAMTGCGGGSSSSGGSSLPSIPTVRFWADGGNATTGASTNGGEGGVINLDAEGSILYDDGRTRPSVTNNAIANLLNGNDTITYT